MRTRRLISNFTSADYELCRNAVVFLDIDHTLLPPNEERVTESVEQAILAIKQIARKIYLTSNGGKHERNQTIAQTYGLSYIQSHYKKPNTKIMLDIKENPPFVVIGDKILTDGMFAKNIGASFICVKRYRSKKESLFDICACFIDDVLGGIVRV